MDSMFGEIEYGLFPNNYSPSSLESGNDLFCSMLELPAPIQERPSSCFVETPFDYEEKPLNRFAIRKVSEECYLEHEERGVYILPDPSDPQKLASRSKKIRRVSSQCTTDSEPLRSALLKKQTRTHPRTAQIAHLKGIIAQMEQILLQTKIHLLQEIRQKYQ